MSHMKVIQHTARCFLVSLWLSCHPMIEGCCPSMTALAALLAHWVEKTKIWLLCCMYCWSMLDCCLDNTLEGSGWDTDMGTLDMGMPPAPGGGPPGPPIPGMGPTPPMLPPRNASAKKVIVIC